MLLEFENITETLFLVSASCTLDWFFQEKDGLSVKPKRSAMMICDLDGRTEIDGAMYDRTSSDVIFDKEL